MSLSLNYYKTMLLSVKTLVVGGKRKVAKPILLLAIIHAIRNLVITENKVKYSDELEDIYLKLYEKYGEQVSPMKYPFYHLVSDGFYHIKGDLPTKSPTSKQLRERIEYVYLDEQLWQLLQSESNRIELQKAIEEYFNLTNQQ